MESGRRARPGAVAVSLAVAMGLAGCGGGGNVRNSPPGTGVPIPPPAERVIGAGTTLALENGEAESRPVVMMGGSTLDNAGAVGGDVDIAVRYGHGNRGIEIGNHDGGTITGKVAAIKSTGTATIVNGGAGSSIGSPGGVGIWLEGQGGVTNADGGTIGGGAIAIRLDEGAWLLNEAGATIIATGKTQGDCGQGGACAIFAPAHEDGSRTLGGVTLFNAGTIVGSVQLNPDMSNHVELSPGGTIEGDLDIGPDRGSNLVLNSEAGTVQSYSDAVTGRTTFGGAMAKEGEGTWIIDTDEVEAGSVSIRGGTLQIGTGGDFGSVDLGRISIAEEGRLVIDRSDDVVLQGGISSPWWGNGTLVHAGSGTLTLTSARTIDIPYIVNERGTLRLGDGQPAGTGQMRQLSQVLNNGILVFNAGGWIGSGVVSGTGSLVQDGPGLLYLSPDSTYAGGTTINNGVLETAGMVPGDVVVNAGGVLDNYTPDPNLWTPGVSGDLANSGEVVVHEHDAAVGGDYTQAAGATLSVSLGSKLDVAGTATLDGGALKIIGADNGYASNSRTEVLSAAGGVDGTFDAFVVDPDASLVFTSTTIHYDANHVWLDTTGVDVTLAAAGTGVDYTPVSMGSAVRVQGAFEQLDRQLAAGDLSAIPDGFLHAAGQFQQARGLVAAQASLRSLSGQLHATAATMTFMAIDAADRALSDRFDTLLGNEAASGMWTRTLDGSGDIGGASFDSVGFQRSGWLAGNDLRIGRSGVAGFTFGRSRGSQWLGHGAAFDDSVANAGTLYAGWLGGNGYLRGSAGFGHFQHDVRRQLLLGRFSHGVQTRYSGSYGAIHGESGWRVGIAGGHVTPFVNVDYARIDREGFAEQGAGGFGLRTEDHTLDRWQAGFGLRTGQHWEVGAKGRSVDLDARVQWQHTLGSRGGVFDASLVGMEAWRPLVGPGLSRHAGVFGLDLEAALSERASLRLGYTYLAGEHGAEQGLTAQLGVVF